MSSTEDIAILVVDDSDVMRRNISAGLRRLGYTTVTGVSNGKTAMEFLTTNRVELVISDWYMEPINGLQLLHFMRNEPDLRDVAFVLISGETVKEKVVEAVKSGIDGYIVKPYSLSVLGVAIHEALKKRDKVGAKAPQQAGNDK